jgi:hypothetical protein
MTVADVLALRQEATDAPIVVEGHLTVTSAFAYLTSGPNDAQGVLVYEPRLAGRLLQAVPPMCGSLVLYSGPASVEGQLYRSTGLPMFPAQVHSVRAIVYRYDDWEPVRLEFTGE